MKDLIHSTEQTRLRRLPQRAVFETARIYAILDEGFVCHVGFAVERQPFVIPTAYVRVGDELLIHGSAASRMIRVASDGIDLCVTVTLVDGLVLARSAFHHSINYRSVVVLGRATMVTDPARKLDALRRFTNHIVPGRWEEVRSPNEQELKATSVLALPIAEASAKVRTGPPVDDEADLGRSVWAGVVPLQTSPGAPEPDAFVAATAAAFDRGRLKMRGGREVA